MEVVARRGETDAGVHWVSVVAPEPDFPGLLLRDAHHVLAPARRTTRCPYGQVARPPHGAALVSAAEGRVASPPQWETGEPSAGVKNRREPGDAHAPASKLLLILVVTDL